MTYDDVTSTIGDRIKALRTGRALTQEDLAAQAGVGLATIQRAERGHRLSADTIASLAAAFAIDARDLTGAEPAPDDQPYVPLETLTTGRQLLAILGGAGRLDFGFDELDDLDTAALVETLHAFCSPVGAERLPASPLERVKHEIDARNLLARLAERGLIVTGGSFTLNCYEVDDDCGAGMPILMAQWKDTCGVIRVGSNGKAITRGYVMDGLDQGETPADGVIFPPGADVETMDGDA